MFCNAVVSSTRVPIDGKPPITPVRLRRFIAVAGLFALVAAGCSSNPGVDDEATTTTAGATEDSIVESGPTTTVERFLPANVGDGTFTVGTLFPLTGAAAEAAPAQTAAATVAVTEINEAGGVLGQEVVLLEGDAGETTDTINQNADRLLIGGVDVMIDTSPAELSASVIDKIIATNVVHFSPTNTAPELTTYPDSGMYFRTAPSDVLQGRVLGNIVSDEGAITAAVIFRQDAYGEGVAGAFRSAFEDLGGEVVQFLPYPVEQESFDAEVGLITAARPDAVIVVGLDESGAILSAMIDQGIGPSVQSVFGVAGNANIGNRMVDPSTIAGMKVVVPANDFSTLTSFTARLATAGAGEAFTTGPETYDAIVIAALAAEIAGTDEPSAVAQQINGVTREGQICVTYADCKALIEGGDDIDYDGVASPYDFASAGEPSAASFRIATFDGGVFVNPDLDEYVFSR